MPDSADLTREIIAAFDALKIPVLLIDRDITPFERSNHDLVGIDNVSAGYALGKHLIASGAKRIAFLMPPHSASTNLQRMLGVAGAVIESGLNWSDRNILYIPPKDKAALKKALSKKQAPDAIVCHNDATAMMLPRSIKVAGFDGLTLQGKRKFPTIHQPINLLAETAISTLLERIRRPNTPQRQILVNADKITDIEITRSS